MRVVLDTNVLVSALRTPQGTCDRVLRLVLSGQAELCYSTAITKEYFEVLHRSRHKLDPVDVDGLLHQFQVDGLLVTPAPLPPLKDRSDTKFLEVAVSARADYLVTGNLKDYPRSPHLDVRIVDAAGLLKAWER